MDEAQNSEPVARPSRYREARSIWAVLSPSLACPRLRHPAHLVPEKQRALASTCSGRRLRRTVRSNTSHCWSLVDGDVWARLGITDTSDFIAWYLKIERKLVLGNGSGRGMAQVVGLGFGNLLELKDILFPLLGVPLPKRSGLLLPKSDPRPSGADGKGSRRKSPRGLLNNYRYLITDRSRRARESGAGLPDADVFGVAHPALPYAASQRRMEQEQLESGHGKSARPSWNTSCPEVMKKGAAGHIIFGRGGLSLLDALSCWCKRGSARAASPSSTQGGLPLRRRVIAEVQRHARDPR